MRKKRVFTLIELLVVVAIIAVLVAMLLPALKKARDAGKQVVCGNNIRQIMVGFLMYANESSDWFSVGDFWDYGGTNNHDFYLGTNKWGEEEGNLYGFMALVKPKRTYQSWPQDPIAFGTTFNPRALYCPSDTGYQYDNSFPKVTWVAGCSSYGYRGLTPWLVHPEWASWTHRFGYSSNYFGPNRNGDSPRPVVADRFCTSTPSHGSHYMVGSTDGSVVAVIDSDGEILQQGIAWNRNTVWNIFDIKTNHIQD
jgi:prepilin-type N-terminal cleavage/methylation domain-containing protein